MIHTLANTIKRGRGRGRGRGAGRGGRGRGRGRGRTKEEPGFKPFTGTGAQLLREGSTGDAGTGVFEDPAADLDAAAVHYLDAVDRLQQQHNEQAARHLAEEEQRKAQEREAAEQRAKEEHARAAELAQRAAEHAACELAEVAARAKLQQEQAAWRSKGKVPAQGDVQLIDLCDSDGEQHPAKQRRLADGLSEAAKQRRADEEARLRRRAAAGLAVPAQLSSARTLSGPAHQACGANGSSATNQQPFSGPSAKPSASGRMPGPSGTAGPAGGSSYQGGAISSNPFLDPPRYIPAGGEDTADTNISTHETVQVLDTGLVPHNCRAVLDTGNAGCTLITAPFARQLGLVDAAGNPSESGSRTMMVRGVVAGASERIKTLHLTYLLKGKRIHCLAGVTEARFGCDLLISRREIMEFEASGFRFRA